MKKYYININDYQGGTWAMGFTDTIKGWKERAIEWCESDESFELLDFIKKHKLNEDLLGIISEIWSIDIVEFNYDNLDTIMEKYSKEDLRFLIQDLMHKISKGVN